MVKKCIELQKKELKLLNMDPCKTFLFFVIIGTLTLPVNADIWHKTDNRVKGRTQQCRPTEPKDFFAVKPSKA